MRVLQVKLATTAAFLAQCSSELTQGPRPSRGGDQDRRRQPSTSCVGDDDTGACRLWRLKALQTWGHAASQSSHILAGAKVVWITNLIALLKAQTSPKGPESQCPAGCGNGIS